MKCESVTLVAATAKKIYTGNVGGAGCYVFSALTDVFVGGPDVNSTTTGMPIADADPMVRISTGRDDLWAISATGGTVKVLSSDN